MEAQILSLEELGSGGHERCHFCRKSFTILDGKMVRFKGMDGRYYCSEVHASARISNQAGSSEDAPAA